MKDFNTNPTSPESQRKIKNKANEKTPHGQNEPSNHTTHK